jgi:hypothetical protein
MMIFSRIGKVEKLLRSEIFKDVLDRKFCFWEFIKKVPEDDGIRVRFMRSVVKRLIGNFLREGRDCCEFFGLTFFSMDDQTLADYNETMTEGRDGSVFDFWERIYPRMNNVLSNYKFSKNDLEILECNPPLADIDLDFERKRKCPLRVRFKKSRNSTKKQFEILKSGTYVETDQDEYFPLEYIIEEESKFLITDSNL